MQPQAPPKPIDYAKAIAALVATMPIERAVQVYEFVRFLHTQPAYPSPLDIDDDDGWMDDSEEQMQTEDALWDAAYTRHPDKFAALAETARAEIAAGVTQPMFNDQQEFALR